MGAKTKIEWCDSTWNPVTGCLHGCEYCYARRIAERFSTAEKYGRSYTPVLDVPMRRYRKHPEPYPNCFQPTFHRYLLDKPQRWKKPRTIFVCSMADLFGDWVPDDWIEEVFAVCKAASDHRYLFLTKNPGRYYDLDKVGKLPKAKNFWYGTTVTSPDMEWFSLTDYNTFVNIEPLMERFPYRTCLEIADWTGWIILGAMTGPGSKQHQPEEDWIFDFVRAADGQVPIFMKDSLPMVFEEDMIREFPWEYFGK